MGSEHVRILHTTINVGFGDAYGFAQNPLNFPKWASGMSQSLEHTDRGWVAQTPIGAARVRFSEKNQFGVLDHWVELEGKPVIYVPLRMVGQGDKTLVELVLFRGPDVSDADFERDAVHVMTDLEALKKLLESGAP